MLKGIAECISPELLYLMMQMGHGDELILADRDFPAHTFSRRVVRADGLMIPTLLEAILPLFPLDQFVEQPVAMMAPVGDEPVEWGNLRKLISLFDPRGENIQFVPRFDFYARARESFIVVVTSEPDGNVILKKGVV